MSGHAGEEGWVAELGVVAGPGSGSSIGLPSGTFRTAGLSVTIDDGPRQARTWIERAGELETIAAGERVLAIGSPGAHECRPTFGRPPRVFADRPIEPLRHSALPPAVRPVPAFSWAALIGPIPVAVLLAFVIRPWFLLFSLMGPVVAAARWLETRRSHRRRTNAREQTVEAAWLELADLRMSQALELAKLRWETHPSVVELAQRAKHRSVRLWERRPGDDDWLSIALGVGPERVAPIVEPGHVADELESLCTDPLILTDVPALVSLADAHLGIVGDRPDALALARAVVLQLATQHGPADLRVGVVRGPAVAAEWEWLKWLPQLDRSLVWFGACGGPDHANDDGNGSAGESYQNRAWMGDGRAARPAAVVIVDNAASSVLHLERAAHEHGVRLHLIALAPTAADLPAACRTIAEPAEMRRRSVVPLHVSDSLTTQLARSLHTVADPEAGHGAAATGDAPGLVELLGTPDPADLAERWARADDGVATLSSRLSGVLGVSCGQPFEVDLVADGPHALVAGTTGAGKSELLRTWVLGLAAASSPEQLHFVLIDFKGGAAFDPVADLPHVAGMITDLDPEHVDRALAGLRVELREREERLRAGPAGVTRALPRIVVVIDEFAALARDYPDLLSGLIDLAERGRSLGIHLVLATQKPAGVVDQRIRANTNLRIALRTQSKHESHDVIESGAAAEIDRRSPGRALVRIGGDEIREIQVSPSDLSGRSHERSAVPRALDDAGGDDAAEDRRRGPEVRRELVEIVRVAAAGLDETQLGPASPLWTPVLVERISLSAVLEQCAAVPGPGLALGLEDRVSTRSQHVHRWDPSLGGIVLYDSNAETGAAFLGTIAQSAEDMGWTCVTLAVDDLDATLSQIEEYEQRCLRPSDAQVQPTTPAVLALDNIAVALGTSNDAGRLELLARLEGIARDGPAAGIGIALVARAVRDVPHRLANHVSHRLLGRLADPSTHLLLGAEAPPGHSPRHVRVVGEGTVALLADADPHPDHDRVTGHRADRGRIIMDGEYSDR
ncbi:MAG: FtsK/SpoIIIE domain-containing protein [Actinomycetota bacterium]